MLIAIEGLPGAGKTTSATLLADRLRGEIVHETTQTHPFLSSVYDDLRRFDFEVELAFLLLHAGVYRRIPRDRLVVSDYSPVKDVLFAEDMLEGPELELWTGVYDRIYERLVLPEIVVYLRVPATACLARVRARGRAFEAGLTLDRLERMGHLYDEQLASLGQLVIDLDVDPAEGPAEVASDIQSRVLDMIAAA